MTILQLKDVSWTIGREHILDHLNIEFWQGHVHAVVGPNGAGKSSLASVIMGLSGYTQFDGDILLEGKSIKGRSVAERAQLGITLAWQEPARFEGLTVVDYLVAAGEKDRKAQEEILATVGFDPDRYMNRQVDTGLSGGERKKVELASIIAMRPKIALLDEPDSGIDIESLDRIFAAVRLLKERGTTVILITHSMTVLNQAEHAFLLCNGQMVDKGSVRKIRSYFENKCVPCPHKVFTPEEITGAQS